MNAPGHVLITGATGQLGAALSRKLAAQARRLSLCALDQEELDALGVTLRRDYLPPVATAALDVRDGDALAAWVGALNAAHPIDWVIMNAGLGGQLAAGEVMETPERTAELVDVNLKGVLNVLHSALPLLLRQGHGQLVIVSSLSALIGYDKAPVYAATKAALRVLALSLRPALRGQGVSLTLVCPGFLDQPMQAGRAGWRPFSITAEAAADKIVRAAERGSAQLHFPFSMTTLVRTLALLPLPLRDAVYRRLSGQA